ncbi:MAG: hypothetical protein BGP10_15870 [Rhodanobacter sp. 68-29]|nr:hypothetical protein [Rhodanobacter sp.]ODV27874.1 MAG: hypothetical protein ABT19_01440 [Rhodanobacter sp. SCN 68-63]OJY61383.1 MAG: hypothetical protein BGP10_15870 [Rhodanobacter sp. 68-29]
MNAVTPLRPARSLHVAQLRTDLCEATAQAWPEPDRFTELRTVLGRWWWAWLLAYIVVCTAAAGLLGAYVWLSAGLSA